MRQPKFTEAYGERRDRLATTFPSAHAFLRDLGADEVLWLSTATNAHVYSGDRFLAYIRIQAPDLEPPSVVLSPRFNNRIADGAVDGSGLLFPGVVDRLLGPTQDWWTRRSGGAVELNSGTPAQFFDGLLAAMREV